MYKTLIASALSSSVCFSAAAQSTFNKDNIILKPLQCSDIIGTTIKFRSSAESQKQEPFISYAAARYRTYPKLDEPTIYIKLEKFRKTPPVGLHFTKAHECYHLRSGDALVAYRYFYKYQSLKSKDRLKVRAKYRRIKLKQELAADCFASQEVRRAGFSIEQLKKYVPQLPSIRGISEKQRQENILKCYMSQPKKTVATAQPN